MIMNGSVRRVIRCGILGRTVPITTTVMLKTSWVNIRIGTIQVMIGLKEAISVTITPTTTGTGTDGLLSGNEGEPAGCRDAL